MSNTAASSVETARNFKLQIAGLNQEIAEVINAIAGTEGLLRARSDKTDSASADLRKRLYELRQARATWMSLRNSVSAEFERFRWFGPPTK